MIEESSREWTPNDVKWLDAMLSTPQGRRFIAKLRYDNRAKPLDLKITPGVDFLQVNALINRDREAKSQLIDDIVKMSQPKETKTPFKEQFRSLIREPEKEPLRAPTPAEAAPPAPHRAPPKRTRKGK